MRVKRKLGKQYDHEFRADCIGLMERDERSYQELGKDLGVHPETLRGWYNKHVARTNKGKKPAKTPVNETVEQKAERLERENARLQKQVAQLEMDREILKKAAAFFAKENE